MASIIAKPRDDKTFATYTGQTQVTDVGGGQKTPTPKLGYNAVGNNPIDSTFMTPDNQFNIGYKAGLQTPAMPTQPQEKQPTAPTQQVPGTAGTANATTQATLPVTPKLPTSQQPVQSQVPTQQPVQSQAMQESPILKQMQDLLTKQNSYLTKLEQMKFEYNPAMDATYMRDASVLENVIVQSMAGRGMLYSSVAQSALQSRLSSMQLDYTKMRYEEFVNERNFTLQQAQVEHNLRSQAFQELGTLYSIDQSERQFAWKQEQTVWENQWKQLMYEQDLQDKILARQWAVEEHNVKLAVMMAEQQMEIINQQTEQEIGRARVMAADYKHSALKLEQINEQWKKNSTATAEVVAFYKSLEINISFGQKYSLSMPHVSRAIGIVSGKGEAVLGELWRLNMDVEYNKLLEEVILGERKELVSNARVKEYMYNDDYEVGATAEYTIPIEEWERRMNPSGTNSNLLAPTPPIAPTPTNR